MHNPKGTPSAPPRRRTVQRPLTWTCGSPGSPTWSNSPSRSGPGGSSWTYTTSGTAPAPWRTSYLTTVKGDTPRPPPWNTPAGGGMWPPATGHQRQRSPTAQGPPRQVARTSHSQSPHRRPTGVAPPCDPQRSPLRPFAHPRPDHGDQRAPDGATGQHSPRTPQPPRGARRSAGARHQSRTPPSAARRVTFQADDDNSPNEPGGRHRRQMSPAAEPQRRTKRPRTDRTPIPTILPPTERARLAALGAHTDTAGATASGSSTASSHARTNDTTPGPHESSAAPRTAIPISAPSVHPSRNGNPTAAPQRRPERPHAPPHTPAYAARGTQGYKAGATEVNVATAPPTMAAQVPPGEPDAAHAAPPTRATVQAQSAESGLHPHNDPATRRPPPMRQ